MKLQVKFLIGLVIAILANATAYAGKIYTASIDSKILGAPRSYNVYLPNGYEQNTDTKYPILYLLHGLSDDHTAWATKGQLQIVLDELISSGEVRPMVVVMPEAGGANINEIWNGYFNMKGWAYQDFFFKEFVPYIESNLRIQADKAHRAVSGLSMGGGGSVSYCQKHPEMFSSCYAFSGWLDAQVDESKRNSTSLNKRELVTFAVHDNSCIEFMKRIDDSGCQALRTVKWFLDCGDDDSLLDLTTDLYRLMRKNKIPCELRVRNGVHNWEYWHTGLRTSLPFASRNFGK